MKVYIDITSLVNVKFITGIQRVVREIVIRMLESKIYDIVLLSYNNNKMVFEIIDNYRFLQCFKYNVSDVNNIKTIKVCNIDEMKAGSVFFDIDSVWFSRLKRSFLLPILKANGVKIAVQIYDIIPVTHPQYCHQNTIYWFMNYLGAHLQYADLVILSTQSTLDAINQLTDSLSVKRINGMVVPLGSDFKEVNKEGFSVDKEIKKISEKRRYLLMVGTIEPRKNHKVVLDAFDLSLHEHDINIIIAGRIGWNVEDLEKRIKSHKHYGNRIFHITDANDTTIDYLYKNAFQVIFPTYNEGFGLPIIEAIERGTPVIASNIGVLKEVGKEYCQYFNQDNPQELAEIVISNLTNIKEYQLRKDRTKEYIPFTWDQSASLMVEAIATLSNNKVLDIPIVKQMFIISARPDDLLETLPFIENMMPFIKEIVICCPDDMIKLVNNIYKGDLKLIFVPETEILNGMPLPADHACRNFFLRYMVVKSDILDDVFIMSDDDYRPLIHITEDIYIKNNKYQAYYCYKIDQWVGTPYNMTSYDISMIKTAAFLKNNMYPTFQYSSHMPQIIDKRIYIEVLNLHAGIELKGYDDWSVYFNYAIYKYPDMFDNQVYLTMGWPGLPTDWNMAVRPTKFVFENYYNEMYKENAIFDGFASNYYEGIQNDNVYKVSLYMNRMIDHELTQNTFKTFEKVYNYNNKQYPSISLIFSESIILKLPQYLILSKKGCTKVPIECRFFEDYASQLPAYLEYYYTLDNGDDLKQAEGININYGMQFFELPVYGLNFEGTYTLHIVCKNNVECVDKTLPVTLV